MPASKLTDLATAVERLVGDGSTVALGTALEAFIPFGAGREIMRQRRRGLVLVGPISDVLFDQLIGAGCVRAVRAAWVGNVITGSGYNFRRAVETGEIEIEDHSNLTLAMALRAGALGVPFLPARTGLGSDLPQTNPSLTATTCPFTGERLLAVRAIVPDVAIVHVQRADETGAAHAWGNLGVTREACLASRQVIVTAEEIVAPEVIRSDPNRVLAPAFKVSAVVHLPWGAHPSPVPGYYNRDHGVYLDYQRQSQNPRAFAEWQARWVDGIGSQADYAAAMGEARLSGLRPSRHAYAEAVDYGY